MPRKFIERTCVVCGRAFDGDPRATVCFDPVCRKTRQKQFQAAADAKRGAAHRRGVVSVAAKPAYSSPLSQAAARHHLPRANDALCQAVALGLSSTPAQKLGVFYVVDFGSDGYKAFIPRADNEYRSRVSQKVALVARLNPRGKWDLRTRPAAHAEQPERSRT